MSTPEASGDNQHFVLNESQQFHADRASDNVGLSDNGRITAAPTLRRSLKQSLMRQMRQELCSTVTESPKQARENLLVAGGNPEQDQARMGFRSGCVPEPELLEISKVLV